jgi:hypothetical protein
MNTSIDILDYKNQIRRIIFHLRLRYIGFPLLVCGVLLLITALIGQNIQWYWKIASVVSCGLSLASFGSNHDTAIAYATSLPHQKLKSLIQLEAANVEPQVKKTLSYILAELEDENSWKQASSIILEPHPWLSSLIPLVTIALQSLIFFEM